MLSSLKVAAATILTLVSFVFAADVTLSIDGTNLNYNSSSDIYGFQFDHDGCASGAGGGDAVANGFTVSASSSTVLAFSFSGSFIPAGSGTLVDLGGECATLTDFVFSGASGVALDAELGGGEPGADHVVEAGSFYYSPADLSVSPGESVEWYNAGGFHDVNGVASSVTGDSFGNPEEFSLGAVTGPASIGTFTFTAPGVYQYDCSIGSHAANGMVGTVTVGIGGCTDDTACNHDNGADFDDGSCEYAEENHDCGGDCTVEVDCAGECGGSAVEDECGVCNGDGSTCEDHHIDLAFGAVTDDSIEILMTNTMGISGFQFNVTGADLSAASGGRAADAGFQVSTGADGIVLGFSFLGDVIPAGSGVLTNLSYTALAAEGCIENEILALDNFSGFYTINIGECAALPFACEDVDGDDICDDVDDCVGEYDECGVCNGGGIGDGACDCDGNVLDCAGECGGSAIVDECGVCDGGNADQDCAGECGGSAVEDECGVCNGDGSSCATTSVDVLYNSAAAIYGFQFQVDGVTLVSAGGGDAESAGFTVSTGNNTVLGFSFDGSSIAAGSGVLTTLEVQGDASAACLSNLVLSGANGASLGDEITDCLTVTYTIPCADVDEDGICDDEDDCVGEYDNCGVCNGDGTSCQQHIDLEFGAVTDGTIEILLTNTMPIAGFQFNVTGADLDGAFGGRAVDAGFEVSTGADGIVLGFSFLGSSIPEGEGVLTNLNYTATAAEGCLENEIFALGDFSGFYEVNIGGCVAFGGSSGDSADVLYDSDANIAGFQFHVDGDVALTNVSGGAAADAGFTISFDGSSNNVIAFSLTGSSIPAGSGVLVNLEYDGS
ncbi:MAG: plastocyanin/azurin family copper-binding protein, partial [Candidatus Marinimicrobia bacterium]|nr:plastocyanin/azurin family copper-binding protein [Candidatus Neomarinimicrobiota bacterium]